MRITVLSDSHGSGVTVDRILNRERVSDVFIFLGDVTSDIEDLAFEHSN